MKYYQTSFLNDLTNEMAEPIDIRAIGNMTLKKIINKMENFCEQKGIPASFRISEAEIGSLLRKRQYEAIEISHPNPPQNYCNQLYVFFPDCIRFFYVGESKAFSEWSNYNASLNGTGGNFKAHMLAISGLQPDREAYEKELEWQDLIISVFRYTISNRD